MVDTGHWADQSRHRGLSRDPPHSNPDGPILSHPQLHTASSIETTAVFTTYFHTCDLARHHPMLILSLPRKGPGLALSR